MKVTSDPTVTVEGLAPGVPTVGSVSTVYPNAPLVLERPLESVMVTATEYDPDVVGRHESVSVVELVQPRPEDREPQLYVSPPDPAFEAVSLNVTLWPISALEGVAVGVAATGSEYTVNSNVPLVLESPSESVMVTATGYVPVVTGVQEIESVVELVQPRLEDREAQLNVSPPDPASMTVVENVTL